MSSLFISWFGNPAWGSVERSKIPAQYLPTDPDMQRFQPQLALITDDVLLNSIQQVVHDARQIFGSLSDDVKLQIKRLNASTFSVEFKNREIENLIDTTTDVRSHVRTLIDDSRDFAATQTVDLALIGMNDALPAQRSTTKPLGESIQEMKIILTHQLHRDYLWGHGQWAYILLETLQNMSEEELRNALTPETKISLLAPVLSWSVAASFHTGKEDGYLNGKGVLVTDESIWSLSVYRGKMKLLDSVLHRIRQIYPTLKVQIIIPTSDPYAGLMNYFSPESLSEDLKPLVQFVQGDHYLKG